IVRAERVRTVVAFALCRAAAIDEGVSFHFLVVPCDFSGIHLDSEDRIGSIGWGERVRVARSDIHALALVIHSRDVPDRATRWSIQRHTLRIFASRLRLFVDDESSP